MFGKGKIQVTIIKTNYAPGDTISGDVVLTLKNPVKVSEMSMSLIGEQTITRRVSTTGNRETTTTEHIRIYDFKQRLDSEK